MIDGTRSGWQTPAEGLGDGTATPGNPGTARLPDGATAALVPLVFAPKQAGMYTSKLVLYSPLDVRVFELAGTAPTPGTRATLEFAAPARRSIKQDLPVVNNSSVAWDLQAMVTGACFRGATSLRVVAGGSEVYTLEFAPEWICSVKGELVLTNAATQDRFAYALNGVGEEPLAEGTVLIEVVARSRASHEFALFNVSADGRECECTVESDLMHVSGEPSVHVPARAGPVPFGKQNFFLGKEDLREAARQQSVAWTGSALASSRRGSALGKPPPARYSLSITPQLGGSVHGSITIKTPDGRYLWYTVEIRAAPPPMEKQIEVSAPVRGAAILEVEIANPSREPVQFSVELEGEGLLGAPTLWIGAGPNAVAKYEVMYSPLLAGVSSGAISFLNPTVGEFWYKLLLTGTQPPPEVLPQFSVELGASGSHALLVENPLAEALTLRATSSNARNWSVGTRGGSALTLPPFGSAEVVLRYNPSAIGVEQGSLIQLTHPRLAPWEYSVSGVGTPPSTMVVTEVSSELHTITSASVSFHNPFDAQVVVGVRLDAPDAREGAFALLLRKTQGILVAPGATLQVSFTFHALEMAEHAASISITLEGAQRLTWRYSIVAYAETKPSMKPLSLAIRARQQLQTILELPLLGLEEHGPSGGFAVELQGVPEECARLVTGASMRMQVAGPPSEERLLPIAVQWTPLRPIKAHASLVVRQEGGGRWKFDVILHAGAPEVDDVILLESTLNRTASVSFSLANAFDADAEFSANFTADSPSPTAARHAFAHSPACTLARPPPPCPFTRAQVFSVTPSRGILPRAGSAGQQLVVSFTPLEYGKNDVGVLVITTAEMQWSYEVRGKPPVFVLPKAKKKIDDKIDPAIERRLQQNKLVSQSKNFLQRNMKL
ncbi:hypothetical protein T492DRAFT_889707 [Pavlovales sp. CCMP2436]|nr:hypothetical protein T492DRAFT_889707 [Pavlovales sp. CCMP2436]